MICMQLDVIVSLTWGSSDFWITLPTFTCTNCLAVHPQVGGKHVHSMGVSKFLNNLQNTYGEGENVGIVYSTSVFPGLQQERSLEEIFGFGVFICV